LQPPSAALPILKKAIAQVESEDDGWISLGIVGRQLTNLVSDFDPRSYGFRKLSDLVRETGAFEVENAASGRARIRAKPTMSTKASAKRKRTAKKKEPSTSAI
jgi:hypothetical protein